MGIDAHAQGFFRPADGALGQCDGQAAVRDIMGRTENFLLDGVATTGLYGELHLEVDPRRRPSGDAMDAFEILAAAEFFPGAAEENHHVTGRFKPRRGYAADLLEQANHADSRRWMDRRAIGFVVETYVAADHRNLQSQTSIAHAANDFGELPHDLRIFRAAEVQAIR